MNTTPLFPSDELFQVEYLIARRADELDRQLGIDPARVLKHWHQAEREIWRDGSATADRAGARKSASVRIADRD